MEMEKAANGPSVPKRAHANEGPLGPSAVFFGLMAFGLIAEFGHNFLLPFKNSAIFFFGLLIFGPLLYNQKTFLRFA